MFNNKLKKLMVGAVVIASITGSVNVDAVATQFRYVYVDSNEFTKVASCSKGTDKSSIAVDLYDIYKADGSESDYKKIKARFRSNGSNVLDNKNEVTIRKDKDSVYKLKSEYRRPGVCINFRAMGNDPALDCKISGQFDVDTN